MTFMRDLLEQVFSLLPKDQRSIIFNSLARQFNIKVAPQNKEEKPMHIEVVRDNFHAIKTALKHQEQRANELESKLEAICGDKNPDPQLVDQLHDISRSYS